MREAALESPYVDMYKQLQQIRSNEGTEKQ